MALKMVHEVDPRDELLRQLGNLNDIKIFNNWILLAVYKRPEKTVGGIIISEQTRKEDEYQGKVGLVVKKGPLAFVDDSQTTFAGQNLDLGEWVVFRTSDGWALEVHGVLCRMIQDTQVRLAVPNPDDAF
jgi:co-chaperonin GroES (HSP10)